jgi:DNA replication protein DnaC
MSDLQHQRIVELCQELRLSATPNLYSGIAQSAAAKEASFADFLKQTQRAERDARSARAREMFARVAGFPTIKMRIPREVARESAMMSPTIPI